MDTIVLKTDSRSVPSWTDVAAWLNTHPRIEKVYYPGLPDHPGHEVGWRQTRNYGGMITIRLRGTRDDTLRFPTSTRIFSLAEAWVAWSRF